MGLFNFFKKKQPEANQSNTEINEPTDNNLLLLLALQERLISMGHNVEMHSQYLALIINSELEIASVIIENPDYHPSLLHLMILTIHPNYFPEGIEENIVGIGETIEQKIESVIDNYLNTTFTPIIDSFTESHYPDLDFFTNNNREILWHPKLGDLTLQGHWNSYPEGESLFDLLKEKVKNKLGNQKFNWLKIYISKMDESEITGECLFNNEPWEEGLEILYHYAKNWKIEGNFLGQKQFIMFRRCDEYDN